MCYAVPEYRRAWRPCRLVAAAFGAVIRAEAARTAERDPLLEQMMAEERERAELAAREGAGGDAGAGAKAAARDARGFKGAGGRGGARDARKLEKLRDRKPRG